MRRTVVKRPSSKYSVKASRYIKADDYEEEYEDPQGLMDAIDDVSDAVEDIQDSMDTMDEDDIDISLNNNISNHYIAECQRCQSVFISAVIDSEQEISHVTGICPICGKETEQQLKWIIKDVNEADKLVLTTSTTEEKPKEEEEK